MSGDYRYLHVGKCTARHLQTDRQDFWQQLRYLTLHSSKCNFQNIISYSHERPGRSKLPSTGNGQGTLVMV